MGQVMANFIEISFQTSLKICFQERNEKNRRINNTFIKGYIKLEISELDYGDREVRADQHHSTDQL